MNERTLSFMGGIGWVPIVNFKRPVAALIPGAQGRVLATLAGTTGELNLRTLAELAGVTGTGVEGASRARPTRRR